VGGIGVRGGEGEKQIEADRRILRQRIRRLERDLAKIERTRAIQRRGRRGAVAVAIAGYTNAGKSTLFNRLTDAGALAEDKLFATLDSKLRRGAVDGGRVLVFADTVGFIRKLPHHLVSSFRSTLGEITAADLVLHVVDRSHPLWDDQMEVAEGVLADLGVDPERVIRVFNKSDLVGGGDGRGRTAADGGAGPRTGAGAGVDGGDGDGRPVASGAADDGAGSGGATDVLASPAPRSGGDGGAIWISAATGEGLDELKTELARRAARLAEGDGAGGTDGDGDGRGAGRAARGRSAARAAAGAEAVGPAGDTDPWAWLDAPLDRDREPSPAGKR
jgi:50S ribosomal subunit-associated GTPase HflX